MPTTFTDGAGRVWTIEPIDFPAVHRVRSLAGLDLLAIARGERTFPQHDGPRIVLALWALVKPTAQHPSVAITVTDFTNAMQASELRAEALAAVLEALAAWKPGAHDSPESN